MATESTILGLTPLTLKNRPRANSTNVNTPPPIPTGPPPRPDKLKMNVDSGGVTTIRDDEAVCYVMQSLLGKGGFAKVYKLSANSDGGSSVLAGKIIAKKRIAKPHNKDRVAREVDIHRRMRHENVVQFVKFFEDLEYVYIILEYCGTRTLSSILKSRKKLLEPEVRYYLKQIVAGCQHIHSNKVAHRDLKLSNLFINDKMQLKIGDFGLSAYISRSDDKKESICGTPNYISPEVILKAGHSYPVDVWAIGCVIYALLAGRPPFETQSLKDTYKLITKSKYSELSSGSAPARCLISKCLRVDPTIRPSLTEILADPFLVHGFIPSSLPVTAATSPPDFNNNQQAVDRRSKDPVPIDTMRYLLETIDEQEIAAEGGRLLHCQHTSTAACERLLEAIQSTFQSIKDKNTKTNPSPLAFDSCIWITKWVDYSHKLGFGYQLSNGVYGACYRDGFSIAVKEDDSLVGLRDADDDGVECHPDQLSAKYTNEYQMMNYFVTYMNDTLIRGGDAEHAIELPALSEVYLLRWMRSKQSIAMCLGTGTVQVNFFSDHSKIAISECGDHYQLIYINPNRQSSIYNLTDIARHGCGHDIKQRLHYTLLQLRKMLAKPQGVSNKDNPICSKAVLKKKAM